MPDSTVQRNKSTPENHSDSASRSLLAVLLGLLLFGLYFLTYSGRLESSDSVSIYSVAESIAKRGAFDSSPFIWDRWTAGYQDAQGDFGVDGELYSKKGLGASLFGAPLTWLALQVPGVGLLQATYLFNMLVTAATAAILFLYALRLGYARDTALLTGVIFGIGTLAWPYARYLYSEPLMGLFLVMAAYFLLLFHQERRLLYLVGGGLAVGWATVTRLTNLVLVPVFFVYALWPFLSEYAQARKSANTPQPFRTILWYAITFALATGTCIVIIGLYNFLRFQTPFRSGYADTAGFWTPLAQGLYGLLLSPEKSLFLYAPILLLAPVSVPAFLKRHTKEGLLLLTLFIAPTLMFAKWMDWEGGLAWGPRYMVSLVPLLVLLSIPGVDWLLHRARWPLRVVFWGLLLFSVAIQIFAASVHFGHYLRVVRTLAASWQELPLAISPPLVPFTFSPRIITPDLIELAWFYVKADGKAAILWPTLLATALFIALASAALLWVRPRALNRKTALWIGTTGVILAALLSIYSLHSYYDNPNRGAGDDYLALVNHLALQARSGDALLVSNHMYMGFFMDYSRARIQWYSLLSQGTDPSPDEITLLNHVLVRHPRVWLAIDRIPALGLPRPAEKWLTQHAYKLDDRVFSDYSRLCLYSIQDLPGPREPERITQLDLGHGIGLVGYDLHSNTSPVGLIPGDDLRFSLLWQASGVPDADFKVFVQLLDDQGKLVWQVDRPPVDGFRPTSSWKTGERIRDNYGMLIPADLTPGHYRLIAGMYNPLNQQRLEITDTDGNAIGDYVELSDITIAPSR